MLVRKGTKKTSPNEGVVAVGEVVGVVAEGVRKPVAEEREDEDSGESEKPLERIYRRGTMRAILNQEKHLKNVGDDDVPEVAPGRKMIKNFFGRGRFSDQETRCIACQR